MVDALNITQIALNYIPFMAILVLAGGVMGFIKAKSKPSLIAGVVSAILLLADYGGLAVSGRIKESLIGAFIIYTLLDTVFAMRLQKTRKFMPAGLILIFCVIGQIVSGISIATTPGKGDFSEEIIKN